MYDRGKRSIHAFSRNIIKIEIKGFFGKWEVSETSHFFFKEDDENRIFFIRCETFLGFSFRCKKK